MTTIKDILKFKGNDVHAVPPTACIKDALQKMAEKGVGAVLVMDGYKVLGIFSERDYARSVILKSKTELVPITEVMTKDVYFVSPENTLEESLAQMTDKRIRHLPVCENNRVVGVVSIGDLVKEMIDNQKDLIRSLENYIMGTGYNQ